jgi:hypothetical protein
VDSWGPSGAGSDVWVTCKDFHGNPANTYQFIVAIGTN